MFAETDTVFIKLATTFWSVGKKASILMTTDNLLQRFVS